MTLARILLLLLLGISTSLSAADSLRVLSQNLNRLFDDIDDGNQEKVLSHDRFLAKVKTAAKKIGSSFALPEIVALQEVENLNVLREIALEIWRRHRLRYQLVLLPGLDPSGINVGYLIHPGLEIHRADQLFRDALLEFDGKPLFTRPPLYLEVCRLQRCLSVLNLHLRSMRGIDSPKDGKRVLAKRLQQANTIAGWVNDFQIANPGAALIVLGDFNALSPADTYLDVAGIIRGNPDNSQTGIKAKDLLEPDLVDLTRQIPQERRYSYIFRKNKQQLDYLMVSREFESSLKSIEFSRIDYRFSDHAGLIARFDW